MKKKKKNNECEECIIKSSDFVLTKKVIVDGVVYEKGEDVSSVEKLKKNKSYFN